MKRILLMPPLLLRGCGLFHCGSLCLNASHIYQRINKACNVNVYIPTNFTNVQIMQYIYIICIYIYTVIHCNIHTVYRNQPLFYTSGQNLNGSPIFTFILQQKTHRFTVIEWRSKDPKCHRPSVEKGGDASLGAFNGCHNLDLPVTVTVANIKFYRDSRRNLNILVVTVYRVGGRSKWSFWLWLNWK